MKMDITYTHYTVGIPKLRNITAYVCAKENVDDGEKGWNYGFQFILYGSVNIIFPISSK